MKRENKHTRNLMSISLFRLPSCNLFRALPNLRLCQQACMSYLLSVLHIIRMRYSVLLYSMCLYYNYNIILNAFNKFLCNVINLLYNIIINVLSVGYY